MWIICGLSLYICSMATIRFFIQTGKTPAGIYVRLKEGRTIDAKARTKYLVSPNDWSKAKGQPADLKEASNKALNQKLTQLKADLTTHYNDSVDLVEINSQWLKNFVNPPKEIETIIEPPKIIPDKLVDYFAYYALHKRSNITESTYKRINVTKRLVESFQKSQGKEFLINEVDANFKLSFDTYCKKENYASTTIAKSMKIIKSVCYHANSNGIENHNQLKGIISTKKADKTDKVLNIFLTPLEIEKIEKKKFDLEHLENAKDWLIISCETGQRVSDFMRFTKEQIRIEDSIPLIEFTQLKTGKKMAIALNKKVLSILAKRQGEFPSKITDQRYNEYIKEVCRIAEITNQVQGGKIDSKTSRKATGLFPKYELVTSHIGRRSFATNNYGKIPTALLMNATGHGTENMFLTYIGKTPTEQAKELSKYNQ